MHWFNPDVANAGAVTASIRNVPADVSGKVSFQVTIDPGLVVDTRIDNVATALATTRTPIIPTPAVR